MTKERAELYAKLPKLVDLIIIDPCRAVPSDQYKAANFNHGDKITVDKEQALELMESIPQRAVLAKEFDPKIHVLRDSKDSSKRQGNRLRNPGVDAQAKRIADLEEQVAALQKAQKK